MLDKNRFKHRPRIEYVHETKPDNWRPSHWKPVSEDNAKHILSGIGAGNDRDCGYRFRIMSWDGKLLYIDP